MQLMLVCAVALLALCRAHADYKLFIGGESKDTPDEKLFSAIAQKCPSVKFVNAVVFHDRQTKMSRGYGYDTMASNTPRLGAIQCLEALKNLVVDGNILDIKWLIPREDNSASAYEKTKKLVFTGLGSETTPAKIEHEIEKCSATGTVAGITCPKGGVCIVEMKNEDMADFVYVQCNLNLGRMEKWVEKGARTTNNSFYSHHNSGGRGGNRGSSANSYTNGQANSYGYGNSGQANSYGHGNSYNRYGQAGYGQAGYDQTGSNRPYAERETAIATLLEKLEKLLLD